MKKIIATTAFLVGCTMIQPISNKATLILKPQIQAGGHTMTVVPVYSKTLINHMILKIYTVNGGETFTGVQKTLSTADLDRSISFANLKPNVSYRVKAFAYFTSDESQLISTADSLLDILMGTEDHPTIGVLNVKMIDRPFSGEATGGLSVTSGSYTLTGPENMGRLGLQGIVTTIAGDGTRAWKDGAALSAEFVEPVGLAINTSGDIYVTDRQGARIRKISNGIVSTLAGDGTNGHVDGQGQTARFSGAHSIALDSSGNLYLTDYDSNYVRKITPSGLVSTIAGCGAAGGDDGTGTAAKFSSPGSVVVKDADTLFVTDFNGHRIRKVTISTGAVTTFAGNGTAGGIDGTGLSARFNSPGGLALDKDGNLFVAEYYGHRIRKITPAGVVTTFAGSGAGGYCNDFGTMAQFNNPAYPIFDADGNLYVGEKHHIRKIAPNGWVSTVAGDGSGYADATGVNALFNWPGQLASDASGTLYVTDRVNNRVRKIQ